jgi:hypothetical protein
MGLVPAGESTGDGDTLGRVLTYVQRAGIGRALIRDGGFGDDPARASELLDRLEEALVESPVPETEWPALERVFGTESLAGLVGVSPSSLRRYASGIRPTPDDVAARLHFLALVVGDLAGSYNEIGIRRWFERPRTRLDGLAPSAFLTGDWDPRGAGPLRVRALAAALLDAPAT